MNSHDKISRNSLVSEYPCKWVKNMDFKDFRDYHITEFFVFLCVSIISWIWCAENELMKIQLTSNISDDCSCTGTICVWSVLPQISGDEYYSFRVLKSPVRLYIMPATQDAYNGCELTFGTDTWSLKLARTWLTTVNSIRRRRRKLWCLKVSFQSENDAKQLKISPTTFI